MEWDYWSHICGGTDARLGYLARGEEWRRRSWFKPFPHRFPPPLDFTAAIRVITAG